MSEYLVKVRADELSHFVRAHDDFVKARKEIETIAGSAIKEIRLHLKMNQRDFADLLDISFTTVCKIERGHLPMSVEIARKSIAIYRCGRKDKEQ